MESFDSTLEMLGMQLHDMSGSLHVIQFCLDEIEGTKLDPSQKIFWERMSASCHELSLQMKQFKEWGKFYEQTRANTSLASILALTTQSTLLMSRKGIPPLQWKFSSSEKFDEVFLPLSGEAQLGIFTGLHFLFTCYAKCPIIEVVYEQSNDQSILKFNVELALGWEGFYANLLKEQGNLGFYQQFKSFGWGTLNKLYLGKLENCYLRYMTNKTKQLCVHFTPKERVVNA